MVVAINTYLVSTLCLLILSAFSSQFDKYFAKKGRVTKCSPKKRKKGNADYLFYTGTQLRAPTST